MIGRLHHVVVDRPDPRALADFCSEQLGQPVTFAEDDFVVVAPLQQLHLDVMVDDVDAAEPKVLALGARRLTEPGSPSRVFADPAGHPFCLIPRPVWAQPVDA